MIKKQLLTAFCASVMAQSASAALVTSTITNGNIVDDYSIQYGVSEFEVTFNNQQSVQINFENRFGRDDITMYLYNNTGTAWAGFDFELVGVGLFGPFDIALQTGTVLSSQFYDPDPATGKASGVALTFGAPEEIGLFNVSGSVDTNFSQYYSLILTPTAVVPVPAALWLFGSGLLGLIGIARRKV